MKLDRENPFQAFWQYNLMQQYAPGLRDGEPEGVCFRLAFKWLACQMTDRPFKSGWRPATLLPKANQVKVLDKQRAYLQQVKPFEGAGKDYHEFLTHVNQISKSTLNAWGAKMKDGAEKYNLRFGDELTTGSLVDQRIFERDGGLMVGVYGDSAVTPWAHATAFYRKDAVIAFFDPNGGEFRMDPDDRFGSEIQQYLTKHYAGVDQGVEYLIRNYVLYPVTG
jgi:hypothetical protein